MVLRKEGLFAINDGRIVSSAGTELEVSKYLSFFQERQDSVH